MDKREKDSPKLSPSKAKLIIAETNWKLLGLLMWIPVLWPFIWEWANYYFDDREFFDTKWDYIDLTSWVVFSILVYVFLNNYINKYRKEKLRYQDEKLKYKSLFESFQVWIFVTDENGKIIEANPIYTGIMWDISWTTVPEFFSKNWIKVIDRFWEEIDYSNLPCEIALREKRHIINKIIWLVLQNWQITRVSVTASPLNIKWCWVMVSSNDITSRIKIEQKFSESQEQLKDSLYFIEQVINLLPASVFYKDLDWRYQYFNDQSCKYYWLEKEDVLWKKASEVYPNHLAEFFEQKDKELIESWLPMVSYEYEMIDNDWIKRFVYEMKVIIKEQDWSAKWIIWISIDITDRKTLEKSIATQKNVLEALFNNYPETLYMVDKDYNTVVWTNWFVSGKQFETEESSKCLYWNKNKCFMRVFMSCENCFINKCFIDWEVLSKSVYNKVDKKYYNIMVFPVIWVDWIIQFVGICIKDITHQKQLEEKIKSQAETDQLTWLLKREQFKEKCLERIPLEHFRKKDNFAIFFIDLDRFKPINDTYGHNVWNLVLQEIANRLKWSCRWSDLIARYWWDEFLIWVFDITWMTDIEVVVKKIHYQLIQPIQVSYNWSSIELEVWASIWISMFSENIKYWDVIDEMIQQADEAMYKAKQSLEDFYFFA